MPLPLGCRRCLLFRCASATMSATPPLFCCRHLLPLPQRAACWCAAGCWCCRHVTPLPARHAAAAATIDYLIDILFIFWWCCRYWFDCWCYFFFLSLICLCHYRPLFFIIYAFAFIFFLFMLISFHLFDYFRFLFWSAFSSLLLSRFSMLLLRHWCHVMLIFSSLRHYWCWLLWCHLFAIISRWFSFFRRWLISSITLIFAMLISLLMPFSCRFFRRFSLSLFISRWWLRQLDTPLRLLPFLSPFHFAIIIFACHERFRLCRDAFGCFSPSMLRWCFISSCRRQFSPCLYATILRFSRLAADTPHALPSH